MKTKMLFNNFSNFFVSSKGFLRSMKRSICVPKTAIFTRCRDGCVKSPAWLVSGVSVRIVNVIDAREVRWT